MTAYNHTAYNHSIACIKSADQYTREAVGSTQTVSAKAIDAWLSSPDGSFCCTCEDPTNVDAYTNLDSGYVQEATGDNPEPPTEGCKFFLGNGEFCPNPSSGRSVFCKGHEESEGMDAALACEEGLLIAHYEAMEGNYGTEGTTELF